MDRPVELLAELRRRAERFASLRAAQRALGRSLRPSELVDALSQGRELVIQMQALSGRAGGGGAADPGELERIDALLDESTRRTRAALERVEVSQLRAVVPLLAEQHPEEVRGLVDLLSEGDLDSDENLRKLEYAVTMLCTEDRGGRRAVVRAPRDLSQPLRDAMGRAGSTPEAEEAEVDLHEATTRLNNGIADLEETSNEMRGVKERLGAAILRPSTFAAAVAYNVAMSNQMSGMVEGDRSIDRLAEELLASSTALPVVASSGEVMTTLLPLVDAFSARLLGNPLPAGPAGEVARACVVEDLGPLELEAFAEGEDDPVSPLLCAAVVAGRICAQREALAEPLHALGIDPDQIAGEGIAELMSEMSAVARKRFADSDYDTAFRISEFKTRHLSKVAPPGASGRTVSVPRLAGSEVVEASVSPWRLGWIALTALSAIVVVALWLSGSSGLTGDDLAQISPLLESGAPTEQGDRTVFVGELHPSWSYLGTGQRRYAAEQIGRALETRGFSSIVLLDGRRRQQIEWKNGAVAFLAPHPDAS